MKRKIFPMQKYTTRAEIPLVTGDVNAYEIELDIGHDIAEAEFKIVAIRADGKVIEDLGTVSDGVATYTLVNNMYSVPGKLTVRLQILHNSSVLTDREIVFKVIEGYEKTLDPETEVPILDNVLLRISSVENKLDKKADKSELEKVSESAEAHKNDTSNPHSVTKEQIGLGNVDNTSDLDKPISRATQNALDKKVNKEDISNVYKFKGSVNSYNDLPTDDLKSGDVYNVIDGGINYAWTGTEWDALGGSHIDVEAREDIEQINTELDKKADKEDMYTKREVDEFLSQYALKGEAKGEVISLTDVSPIEHNLGVKVSSENLIPYPYYETELTKNGLTLTVNEDGSVVVNGTAEAATQFHLYHCTGLGILSPDTQYTLSGCSGGSGTTYDFRITDGVASAYICSNTPVSFSYPSDTKQIYISLVIRNGITMDNVVFYPMLEKGTVATPYTPFVEDISTVTLNTLGKNLFPKEALDISNYTRLKYATYEYLLPVIAPGTYYMSAKPSPDNTADNIGYFYIYRKPIDSAEDWEIHVQMIRDSAYVISPIITIESGYEYKFWAYTSVLDVLPLDFLTDVQIEVGETATEYEEYKEPTTYTPNADGTVEGVMSISPNMKLLTDTQGVVIDCEYNKDLNKVIENLTNAIISLGGNV